MQELRIIPIAFLPKLYESIVQFTRKYKTQIEEQPAKQLVCVLQKHQYNEIKCPKLF